VDSINRTGGRAEAATLSGDDSIVLPEFDAPPDDPVRLLGRWLEIAAAHQVREPRAMVLATANELGRPSSRVVLLKDIVNGGLVFTSYRDSRKGRELTASPWASATFYWRETLQQINVLGSVERLPDDQSNALFAERPIEAQVTTAVSAQSQPLTDEQELHERAQRLIDGGGPVERPADWGGYRLVPDSIEFWHGRATRLHRRLHYTRAGSGWTNQRLQP